MNAEDLLREGRLDEALIELQNQVKSDPSLAKHRVFLFQLLCVLGQWDRALKQLNVAAELDAVNLLMAEVCRPALQCEVLRDRVFRGERSPLIFGEPDEWIGWMVQANALQATGQASAAAELREKALEEAPAVSGSIDGVAFDWIMDADPRLGPMVEAIVEGRYYWVPIARIHQLQIEAPSDLRDLVWIPARFTWTNGGQSVGLIPSRYPGSEASDDGAIRMARRTDWVDADGDVQLGLGQRLWTTNVDDYPLLGTRHLVLDNAQFTEDASGEVQGDSIAAVTKLPGKGIADDG